MSKNPKKLVKVVNIDGENLHIFWTTSGISMKGYNAMSLCFDWRIGLFTTIVYDRKVWKDHVSQNKASAPKLESQIGSHWNSNMEKFSHCWPFHF